MKRSFVIIFLLLIIIIGVSTSGCDTIFYYPTRTRYKEVKGDFTDVYIPSESGSQLHGFYFKSSKDPKGVVLFFHGNYRNITALYKSFSWLTKYGYDYLIFDYSGYGESSGRPGRQAIFRDGIAMLDYGYKLSEKNSYPLIVIGQSIGGAVLLGSVKSFSHKEAISLLCIDCSFPSYKDVANYHTLNSTKLPIPLGSLIITDNHDPRYSYSSIKDIPVLVSHCRQDQTVPFHFGQELFNGLEGEKWFWEFDCKHSGAYWKKENQKKLADFFESRLKSN